MRWSKFQLRPAVLQLSSYFICLLLFVLHACEQSVGIHRQSLNGPWKICDSTGKYTELDGLVPGGIYTDLQRNGIIGDIFYGYNDVNTRWVSKLQWNYTRHFIVDAAVLDYQHATLIFEGADTFATIYLNGNEIGKLENMFVRYELNIDDRLKPGDNHLSVLFDSAVTRAQQLYDEQAKNYAIPPKCVPNEYNGECHANHVRKMQASFAWDWGPAFPSVGLWKDTYLIAFDVTYITYVTFGEVRQVDEDYVFNVTTYVAGNGQQQQLKGVLTITMSNKLGKDIINYDINEPLEDGEFIIRKEFRLPTAKFELWWPNGFGKQNLYDLRVSLKSGGDESTKEMRVGIRRVELVQKTIGSGLSFYFQVNNIPIFAKGSNMVPSHILPEHSNNVTLIRRILQNAKDVHMNMIRVWGGGLYESDEFYNIADEMGIMIWHDFMFACAMYPTNKPFLRNVEMEVAHQVRRLQHHPCIVLWAGNNENEAALRGNWYGTSSNYSTYADDYRQLYGKTIRHQTARHDPSGIYLTSSPTNGVKSEEEDLIALNPYSNAYGDVHFYNYMFDSWDSNIYPVTRFASEYGYQAFPSYEAMKTATNNDFDLYINSKFMAHRQHHPLGNAEIPYLIGLRLQLPPKSNTPQYIKALLFYSQIIQAMAVKVETEHYRTWRSYLNSDGSGYTMGALYWQLNCPWIAPTWSSVDALGNWKMLHYYAKEFFAPVIVTSRMNVDKSVDVFVVSDLLSTIHNATVKYTIMAWDSLIPIAEFTSKVNITTGSLRLGRFNLRLLLGRRDNCDMRNCFMKLMLLHENQIIAPQHCILPVAPKNATIQFANVQIDRVEKISLRKFCVYVTTNKPAAFVWLESSLMGRFSVNGFIMAEQWREVEFEMDEGSSTGDVLRSLRITHLRDKIYFP